MWRFKIILLALLACSSPTAASLELDLPPRKASAPTGSALVQLLAGMSLEEREARIYREVVTGNVPPHLRSFVPIPSFCGTNQINFFVLPNYLALGSDDDYWIVPLSPLVAQRICDRTGTQLPTSLMVDLIYSNASIRLPPLPLPPDNKMTSVERFLEHTVLVREQLLSLGIPNFPTNLVAGHKKDVVLASGLQQRPGKVAIYGWHRTNFTPIQPLYLGHSAGWVDYSQCVRLVYQEVWVNGQTRKLADVLADPSCCPGLSRECPFELAQYPPPGPQDVFLSNRLSDEQYAYFYLPKGVRVLVNRSRKTAAQEWVVFYALPNGNTIEQTFGRKKTPNQDWRYDIQHIGAQTRFVRASLPEIDLKVIYLENELLSWPAWRKQNSDSGILPMLEEISRMAGANVSANWILTGHSGGGSLTFGLLNSVTTIPSLIKRMAFLDSNYAYDAELGHHAKIKHWLEADPTHKLMVFAYDDASALLNGKPFVSVAGGTWGRSYALLNDLGISISTNVHSVPWVYEALKGQVRFWMIPNPERKVLHTVQVARNGFIHALLAGTPHENQGYEYWGEPAYQTQISSIQD